MVIAFDTLPLAQQRVLRMALMDQNRLIERSGRKFYYEHAPGDPEELEAARLELLAAAGLDQR